MNKMLMMAAFVLVAGCGAKPSASDVCKKLEAAGAAANCRPAPATGLSASASSRIDFDLPSVPGKTGWVGSFADDAAYDSTVKAFDGAAALAGPHRYGSKKARIFVQANSGLAADKGAAIKNIVDAL